MTQFRDITFRLLVLLLNCVIIKDTTTLIETTIF